MKNLQKYLISFLKRLFGMLVFVVIPCVMVIPFIITFMFYGVDKSNQMADKIAIYFINLLE